MTHCKICGRRVNVATKKNGHEIYQCPTCNFFFSEAHASPEYYNDEYWTKEDAGWKDRNRKEQLQNHIDLLLTHNPKPKKILDFGCGYGDFTTYLRKKGYDAYGCDPFPDLPKKKHFAHDYVPWLHLYDVITMIEVLEHLPNPLDALKELRKCTRKKGILYIHTGIWNEDETIEKWWYTSPPNHCNYFTTQSMERILTLSGWKVEWMRSPRTIARAEKGKNNAI